MSITPITLGPYTLIEKIGEGGMGAVWRARRADGSIERDVALKLIAPGMRSHATRERFARERAILATLAHPNIARLYDAGVTDDGQPFLVLELVEGEPIDAYCDRLKLDVSARLKLFIQVLGALAHAHQRLVVHRDIKPSNILVSVDGTVKLLDFGVSKLLAPSTEATQSSALTQEVGRMLTPEFASPEQLRGEASTTASDVYGAGALLFLLLTGRSPHSAAAGSPVQLARAILEDDAPLASTLVCTRTRIWRRDTPVAKTANAPKTTEIAPTLPSAQITTTQHTVTNAAEPTRNLPPDATEVAQRQGTTPQKLAESLRGDLDLILAQSLRKDPFTRYPTALAFADDITAFLEQRPIRARAESIRYRALKFANRNRVSVAAAALAVLAVAGGVASALWFGFEAQAHAAVARAETEKANAIRDYLVGIFRAVGRDAHEFPKRGNTTAQELLDHSARRIDAKFLTQPDIRAYLHETVSGIYFDLDLTPQALEVTRQWEQASRESAERTGAPVAAARVQQGVVLTRMGKADEARKTLLAAKAQLQSQTPGELWARLHLALGLLYAEEYQHAEAAAALAEVGRVPALSPESKAELQYVTGQAKFRFGALAEGAKHMREAAVATQALQGASSTRYADVLWRLGLIETYRNDWPAAERALAAALSLISQRSGASHRDTIVAKRELANALVRQGQRERAFALMDEALSGARERAAADKNIGLLSSVLQSWGRVHLYAGDTAAAHRAFIEALALTQEAKLGETFEGFVKFDLAQSSTALGQTAPAGDYARAAIAAYERSQGLQSPLTLNAKFTLAASVGHHAPALAEDWFASGLAMPTTELAYPSSLVRVRLQRVLDDVASPPSRVDAELTALERLAHGRPENGEAQLRLAQIAVVRVLRVSDQRGSTCGSVPAAAAVISAHQVQSAHWVALARDASAICA